MNLVGEPEDEGESGKENNCPDEKDRDRGMSEGEWWWTRILIKETRQKEAKGAVHAISAISESITWLLQTTNARIIEINSIYIYIIELWPKSRKSIVILSCNELSFFFTDIYLIFE